MALVFVATTSTACLSSNTFGTARTVARGEVMHTIGISTFPDPNSDAGFGTVIPMPSYGLRVGLSDDVDVGGTVVAVGHVDGDVKYHFIRSQYFDMAVAPGIFGQWYPSTSGNKEAAWLLGVQAVALMNVNLSSAISLVPAFGPGYAWAPETKTHASFLRAGFGIDLRFDAVTIHPEIATAFDPARGETTDIAVGVGVAFGGRPHF